MAAQQPAPTCSAQAAGSRVQVSCPSATVAEFLGVMERATGLRSEYPKEFASARVSVSSQAASLLDVLGSALAGFNFVVWVEPDQTDGARLSIVDRRGSRPAADSPL